MLKVSAVLLNFARPHNLPVIVESLRRIEAIDEVIIWDNSGRLSPLDYPGALIRHSFENLFTLGRFKAAALARNNTIYTADDDVIVNNVQKLIELHRANPEHIVAGLTSGHFKTEAMKKPWQQLGWGSCFNRDWISVLDHWVDLFGEDELLRRKADRIFTILHPPHLPIHADVTPLTDPNGRLSESSPDALYRRPDHYQLTAAATTKAVELRDFIHSRNRQC